VREALEKMGFGLEDYWVAIKSYHMGRHATNSTEKADGQTTFEGSKIGLLWKQFEGPEFYWGRDKQNKAYNWRVMPQVTSFVQTRFSEEKTQLESLIRYVYIMSKIMYVPKHCTLSYLHGCHSSRIKGLVISVLKKLKPKNVMSVLCLCDREYDNEADLKKSDWGQRLVEDAALEPYVDEDLFGLFETREEKQDSKKRARANDTSTSTMPPPDGRPQRSTNSVYRRDPGSTNQNVTQGGIRQMGKRARP